MRKWKGLDVPVEPEKDWQKWMMNPATICHQGTKDSCEDIRNKMHCKGAAACRTCIYSYTHGEARKSFYEKTFNKKEIEILMSTRCLIGLEEPDGSCRMIYCHHDGYPFHVGAVLFEHYTRGKLEGLLTLGDISSLHETLKDTAAYARDMGEAMSPNWKYKDAYDLLHHAFSSADAEWVYLWRDQVDLFSPKAGWYCASTWRPISELKPLEEVLHEGD